MIGMMALVANVAAASSQAPAAAAPSPTAIEEISRHKLEIRESAPGVYSGRGWDQLIADGGAASFFMIGEQHMTADIAQFGAAVHKALATRGYTHAAYEVGPYSTVVAEQLIRSGKGKLEAHIRKPGYSIAFPFLFLQEEVELAEQIVASSPDKTRALWGLDQEFGFAGPIAVDLLRNWSNTAAERSATEEFASKIKSNANFIAEKPWSDFAAVEAAFSKNSQATKFLNDLRLSNTIYAPFTGRGGSGYEANLLRETYMKKNFATQFAEAEKRNGRPPKVFLKFGGYHAQKGFTGTNVPGLGNFLYEWGLPRGLGFVNIMVDCEGGSGRNLQTNETHPCAPYFSKDAILKKVPKTDRLTLIDLRPLRKQLRRLPDLDQESRQLILSFDYYLAIKNVKAATHVAANPEK